MGRVEGKKKSIAVPVDGLRKSSSPPRIDKNTPVVSFGIRDLGPIVSTTDAQDDDFVAPGLIGNAKGRTGKRSRQAGRIGSKGMPNSHPWDDNESELIMTLRASGVS